MRLALCLVGLLVMVCCAAASAADRPLTVFAAASLRESLDNVEQAWEATGHQKVVVSYAASSALAKQIEQDAPADIFISADSEWMDYLQDRKLIEPASRFVLVRNALVLIAPATSLLQSLDPTKKDAVLAALGSGRFAVAETSSVPAGRYARQALEKLGLWNDLSTRLAQGENVRATLEYVARGDTPLGIVYLTDARAEPRVKVLAVFDEKTHEKILYPAARTVAAEPKPAAEFLAFLRSKQAVAIFRGAGFVDGH
jgi:molybdate transport system substrate-binding protein